MFIRNAAVLAYGWYGRIPCIGETLSPWVK